MNILVINCGSSSVKAAVINSSTGKYHLTMKIERIQDNPLIHINDQSFECTEVGH